MTDNERIARWVSDQVLEVLRTNVTYAQVVGRPGGRSWACRCTRPRSSRPPSRPATGSSRPTGSRSTRMGNFDINLVPRTPPSSSSWPRTAPIPSWPAKVRQHAAARWRSAPGRAWPGRRRDPGRVPRRGPAGLGGGLAARFQQQQAPPPAPAPAPAPAAARRPHPRRPAWPAPTARRSNPAGASSAWTCAGQAMAPAVKHCTECGTRAVPRRGQVLRQLRGTRPADRLDRARR